VLRDVARRRQAIGLLIIGVVIVALSFGFGHRGVHAVRSLIVPGAGLYDHRHWVLGAAITVAAIVATYGWLRWGTDWLLLAVVVGSMAVSAALAYTDHPATVATTAAVVVHPSAHEFPLVVLVMGGVSWVRMAWRRSALGRRRVERAALPVADRCRAAAIAALVPNASSPVEVPERSAIDRRARWVGLVARGRFGGDPLRIDHAHARASLSLTRGLDHSTSARFAHDASTSVAGVPASEPGWVRLLDGTLAAIALERLGDDQVANRWAEMLDGPLALRRGHRASAWWTPLAVRGPRAAAWEQAAATALARANGWISTDDDWHAVRVRALAAAARGNTIADDERLVAAARLWLRFVDDDQAARILGRVTVHLDPIAVALDAVASSLTTTWSPR